MKKYIIIYILLGSLFLSAAGAVAQMHLFDISPETQISAPDMDCNYRNEDHSKALYDFAYPKLITTNNDKPLVAFVDEKSKNVFFIEITNLDVRILYNQPSHDLNSWRRWPIIFEKGDKIYFVLLSSEGYQKPNSWVKVYLFNRENKKLTLLDNKIFKLGNRCALWGIYPYNANYMLIGRCEYISIRYIIPFLISGVPEFWYNTSFLLEDGGKDLTRQSIEEQGCYNVINQVYEVSSSGELQSAWVRNTTTIGLNHDETIYLSTNKNGTNWLPPIELYSVENTKVVNNHINNLSLASYGNSSYVLWQDREKGIFFSEINNGKKVEPTQISNMQEPYFIHPMVLAPVIKVSADNRGNAFALWIENSCSDYRSSDYKYKLHFRARIAGQWLPELIINQGNGVAKLPDMKVDKEGNVHITYIKSINENVTYGKYGCFYMKLVRQDKKAPAEKK